MRAYAQRHGSGARVRIKDGRRYVGSERFDTLEAAQAYADEFNRQEEKSEAEAIEADRYIHPAAMTVEQMLQQHWESRICLMSDGHQQFAKAKIFNRLVPFLGHIPVAKLTDDDIAEYARHQFSRAEVRLRAEKAKTRAPRLKRQKNERNVRIGRGFGSVIGDINILRAAINGLVQRPDGLKRNPVPRAGQIVREQARVLRVEPEQIETWNEDQLPRVLELLETGYPRLFPSCHFAAMTGARHSEIHRLRWPDLRLDEHRGYIGKSKWGKSRHIDLPQGLVDWLRAYQKSWRRQYGPRLNLQTGLVFPTPRGSQWSVSNFTNAFKRARISMEERGLPPLHFHCFRHTYASISIRHHLQRGGDNDFAWIANQIGDSLKVFLETYAHLIHQTRDLTYLDDLRAPAKGADVVAFPDRRQRGA